MSQLLELLKQRRSIRKYQDQKVEQEKIAQLLKAWEIAPSGKNLKSCELVILQNRELIRQLALCKATSTAAMDTAPLVFVILGDKEKSDVWIEDCAIVSTILQEEAADLGLGSCWIQMRLRSSGTAPSEDAIRKLLNIPDRYGILCAVTVGYPAETKEPYSDPVPNPSKLHYETF
ncbi:nitroreductase family protein [Anaerolentibacter hominis]|uniref:nitroreductase family protein n=1 Tax=Anaerolentibacter hominis TaxID=3079009 RepID=UPI0031B818A9